MITPTISIPLGLETDIKAKKKNDEESLKPVENSGDSSGTKSYLYKENIITIQVEKSTSETCDIYDTRGLLKKKESLPHKEYRGNPTIDIIV